MRERETMRFRRVPQRRGRVGRHRMPGPSWVGFARLVSAIVLAYVVGFAR